MMCFVAAIGFLALAWLSRDDAGIAVGLVMLAALSGEIGREFLPRRSSSRVYRPARIVGARAGSGTGTFVVEASHNLHVTEELELPPSSVVTIMGSGTYQVEFPTEARFRPEEWKAEVWDPQGNVKAVDIRLTQPEWDREKVTEWARSNGYEGEVE